MKRIFFLAIFAATQAAVFGNPPSDLVYNDQVRDQATQLFASGKSQQAIAQLNASLRKTPGVDDRIELAQQLATIAFSFHNSHQYATAVSVAQEAIKSAGPILASPQRDGYSASLLTNLGVLAEVVLHDPIAARAHYAAALASQPANERARGAVSAIDAKSGGDRGPKN